MRTPWAAVLLCWHSRPEFYLRKGGPKAAFFLALSQGNSEAHHTAFTIFYINTPAVALDDMLADGKPKAGGNLPATVLFHTEEAFENTAS